MSFMIADQFFDQLIETGVTHCVSAALVKENEMTYRYTKGYGRPNREGLPITESTQFNVGSVTKAVTAALIIKLAELGKISIDDPVSKYIAEYRNANVLIWHLMTHSAGYTEDPWKSWPWPKTGGLPQYFQMIYEAECSNPPGQNSVYYSFGYSILMDLLERVVGESIESFARRYLFEPLGMKRSTYQTECLKPGDYTVPFVADNTDCDWSLDRLAPTGDSGLYTTADDLLKFAGLFLNGGICEGNRVFSPAAIDLMLREYWAPFSRSPIFWMKKNKDTFGCFGELLSPQAVGHPGFSGSFLFIDPGLRMAGVILSNSLKLHSDWSYYRKTSNIMAAM